MGGPLRNKQWLRIAVVLGVLLLVVYLMTSMRSGAKLIEDKLAVAELDNRDLLDKFNKLTEELKRTFLLFNSACFNTSVHTFWGLVVRHQFIINAGHMHIIMTVLNMSECTVYM